MIINILTTITNIYHLYDKIIVLHILKLFRSCLCQYFNYQNLLINKRKHITDAIITTVYKYIMHFIDILLMKDQDITNAIRKSLHFI